MTIHTQNLRTGKMYTRVGTTTTDPNLRTVFVPTPADLDDLVAGSFLLAITGFTVALTVPVIYKYSASYQLAFLFLPSISGTANATTLTGTPLTQPLIPASLATQEHGLLGFNNGTPLEVCSFEVSTGSNIFTFLNTGNVSGWTNGGNNGIYPQVVKLFLN